MEQFDEVDLNHLLVLVQDKLERLRLERPNMGPGRFQSTVETYSALSTKILELLDG